jgi:hypothetical protein
VLENESQQNITISKIQLMDMHNFSDFRPEMLFMGENEDHGLVIGNRRGFPPHLSAGSIRDLWTGHGPSIGTPLTPTPRSNAYNFVVGIVLPRPGDASFGHIQFTYHTADGKKYLLNDPTSYRFVAGHC